MTTNQLIPDVPITIEELKLRTEIGEVISQRVPLTKAGRGWMAYCPFHPDKTMTFHVFTDCQEWCCNGDCDDGGDVIKFMMRFEDLTLGEACRKLAIQCGIAQADPPGDLLVGLFKKYGLRTAADDQSGGRTAQFRDIRTVSDLLDRGAAEEPVLDDRTAPDGPEEYLDRLRQRRRQLEEASLPNRQAFKSRLHRYASLREGPRPVLGNLAYHRELENPRLRPVVSSQQPGLVIATFHNLQPHLMLEEPTGKTSIMDTEDFRDGGEIVWTERGTAIVKDLQTGAHSPEEVEIKGITTRGFCLLRPPGQRDHAWFAPRAPSGQNRPTYLADGTSLAMESFSTDAEVLPGFWDISGAFVKLRAPERIPRRHRERLAIGH